MDISNKFLVGANAKGIVIQCLEQPMSNRDAVLLAAWLVAISGASPIAFGDLLDKVRNARD